MKKKIKRILEKIIEGVLLTSSTITSLVIVLIVVFLFREGISLFNQTPLEESYVLVTNVSNPVKSLSDAQVKKIFDSEITNWSELQGPEQDILLFRIDDIGNYFTEEQLGDTFQFVGPCISKLVDSLPGIIAFFPEKYFLKDFKGRKVEIADVSVSGFLKGKEWFPTAHPVAQIGALPLILGTLWVSLAAILIAIPLGLATAVYIAEIASPKMRALLKPLVELLSGIPSVVFGFFGLIVIVPQIQKIFNLPVGETALAGSIILGIMALPTMITISEDALRNTPKEMREASLALGANKWQTIYRVVIPYSASGITSAAILGIGRAVGETMAVLMVTGNAALIPNTLLAPVRTIPATIAAELGEAAQGGLHYKSLFALGCILFIMTMCINLIVEFISSRNKHKAH